MNPALKRKEAKAIKTPAGVGLIKAPSPLNVHVDAEQKSKADVDLQLLPFISRWFVSLTGALSSDVFLACQLHMHKLIKWVKL